MAENIAQLNMLVFLPAFRAHQMAEMADTAQTQHPRAAEDAQVLLAPTFSLTAHGAGLGGTNAAHEGLNFGSKELMDSLQGQELDQLLIQHANLNLC